MSPKTRGAAIRTLVIDDNGETYAALCRILTASPVGFVAETESGGGEGVPATFEADRSTGGNDALRAMVEASAQDRPYALVFIDLALSMAGGQDVLSTMDLIWQSFPLTQIVLCSSNSEFTQRTAHARFGLNDRLLFASKPFRVLEVRQLALALGRRWHLERHMHDHMRELEASLRLYSERLQEKVSHLTLQKRELAKSKFKAEAASRAKSQFVASVSHEIRTPLHGILGMLSLVEATPLDPDVAENVHIAASSGESLLRLIDDLLDFSRIESGRVELVRTAFRVSEVVAEVNATHRQMAAERGLDLRIETDPQLSTAVFGDPDRLRQVLVNLVSNAIKFTPSGHVLIRANLTEQSPAGDTIAVQFEVQDTGIGIASHALDRIFELFTQADASTSRLFGGTGLGLSISRQLVQLMGGEMGVHSEVDRGSTFWFTVPFHRASEEAQPDPEPQRVIPRDSSRIRGLSVLVADDNPVNQKVASKTLERLGCQVTLAGNGAQAVEQFRSGEFDLVFMDCEMPIMDGFAATQEIRSLGGRGRAVPIIALTAHALSEVRQQCFSAGMDDYLSKPLRIKDMRDAVLTWLPDDAKAVSPSTKDIQTAVDSELEGLAQPSEGSLTVDP